MFYDQNKLKGIVRDSAVLINCAGLPYEWHEGIVVELTEEGAVIDLLKPVMINVLTAGSFPIELDELNAVVNMTAWLGDIHENAPLNLEGGASLVAKIKLSQAVYVDTVNLKWAEELGEGYLPFLQLKTEAK